MLKATLEKNRQQRDARARDERKQWQQKAGVKTVQASEPEGGW